MSTDAKSHLVRRARELGIRVNAAWSPARLKEAIRSKLRKDQIK